MALYGVNATKRDNQFVKDLTPQGEYGGNARWAYDYYTSSVAAIALNEEIKLMKLPAGARVVGVLAKWDDHGTSGTATLGWEANGTESADLDGLIASIDMKTSASSTATLAAAAIFQKFTAETQITLKITEATDASTSKSIWVGVQYVVE